MKRKENNTALGWILDIYPLYLHLWKIFYLQMMVGLKHTLRKHMNANASCVTAL